MRIVGGRLRGRVLNAPASRAIRPTSERLRESIFDILVHRYADLLDGARVVDLFAGSGALGFEAMSRRSRLAASRASGAPMRPGSAGRRQAPRSRSPFSIRPMARA